MIAGRLICSPLFIRSIKTLIHSIRKIAALTSRNDILNNEPKEQLMKRSHDTFLYGLGSFQPCLLAQCLSSFQQPCSPKHGLVLPDLHIKTFSNNTQNCTRIFGIEFQFLPINFTCHHSIGDIAICIKFGQIWDRTPQLGVCKQFYPWP